MTQLLEQAIAEISKLSAQDQDALAALILAQLSDDRGWDIAFADSQDQLAKMAAKVREDIRLRRIRKVEIDELEFAIHRGQL
jgi:hypothetical protein